MNNIAISGPEKRDILKFEKLKQKVVVSLALTITGITLWLYSLSESGLVIGYFGLIHSFTLHFFSALSLLLIASSMLWLSTENHPILLSIQLCQIIVALWFTPFLIGGSEPVAWHGYTFFGFIEYINRQGRLSPERLWYHQWPGNWIAYSILLQILGVNSPDFMIDIMPFAWQFLYLIPLYSFLKNTLVNERINYAWAGLLIFYLGNWVGQSYIGPQSLAYLLFLIMLSLLSKSSKEGVAYKPSISIIISIILGSLTIIHPLTSLVVVAVLFALHITKRIKSNVLVMPGTTFFMVWMLYGASAFFSGNLRFFIYDIFRIDEFLKVGFLERMTGNESHQAVVNIRILASVILFSVAFIGMLVSHKIKKSEHMDKTILSMVFGILIIPFFMGARLHELPERTLFFVLPIIAYFGKKLLSLKITFYALVILLLFLFPLHIVSHYGNQVVDYWSPADVAGLYFFHDHTSSGYVAGVIPPSRGLPGIGQPFGWFRYPEQYIGINLHKLEIGNIIKYKDYPIYIPTGRRDKAMYDFKYNALESYRLILNILNNVPNSNLIYSNPDISIYIIEKA
jgi:hypothetical protein